MNFSEAAFKDQWAASGEDTTPHFVETAWRRYQQVQAKEHISQTESEDLTSQQLNVSYNALLSDTAISNAVASYKLISQPANRIPWTATGIQLTSDQSVSTFASGRVWRSRLLDLYLKPQFTLWFKIGVNGRIFNSTGDSNTLAPSSSGELYIANQFPNQFAGPDGRVYDNLGAYFNADGHTDILIIVWKPGTDTKSLMENCQVSDREGRQLVDMELSRLKLEQDRPVPKDWEYLWFLGQSNIYATPKPTQGAQTCINCKPHETVGIIQKTMDPAVSFGPGQSTVSWTWTISALPSRLREDTTFTHDYLSLAFEFENGRDLTYTWSYELPEEYGYWCPLPTWTDREYHVVIRSGTKQLGESLAEKRDLYADYMKYIEEGKEDEERMPKQIVKVWLIAGNWFQKYDGEMTIQDIRIGEGDRAVQVLYGKSIF